MEVVSHRQRHKAKIRLGLIVAGLAAAGAASLPTLLGPDASAAQPPVFTTNPTGTTTASPTKPPATPPSVVGRCGPEYTDNNWCWPRG